MPNRIPTGGEVILLEQHLLHDYRLRVAETFPEFAELVEIEGYDWMGRPFGRGKCETSSAFIYDAIFDELLAFECWGPDLFDSPLFDPTSDNFGRHDFERFLEVEKAPNLPVGKCAGFKVPPQFGGEVSITNMEIYDVFAYWHFVTVLHQITEVLPAGTLLRNISIV